MPSKEVRGIGSVREFQAGGVPGDSWVNGRFFSWWDRRDAGPTRIGGLLRSGPDPKIPRVHPAGGLRAIWLVGGRGAG